MSEKSLSHNAFVKKVIELVEANLDNEQFGVNELSGKLGISRSHLHRKLQSLTGKSTSQFIREYRLEKAFTLLQASDTTASEIAYKVGFNSPTYFNTSFSDYFGYPPGEVKYRKSTSDDTSLTYVDKLKGTTKIQNEDTSKPSKARSFKGLIIGALVCLTVIVQVVLSKKEAKDNPTIKSQIVKLNEKKIVVLPFKNLSDDENNQYFADGMREDIINHLSKINDLIIKTIETSDFYSSTNLSSKEIIAQLDVDYVINGSIQRYENRIKIIVHLINAKNDNHIWSKDFDREFQDIFDLESEISRDIANELDVVISPNELNLIDKIPTENIEAYNLYLKGKYFLYQFKDHSFEIAHDYLKRSVALDPEFALAYSGLAEIYLYKSHPRIPKSDYLKAEEYALKAIKLDNNLSETHRVLGTIYMEYAWEWDKAETEFKIALEKDPNNISVLLAYGKFLKFIKGDFDKSLEYLKRAQKLAPLSYYGQVLIAECYFMREEYDLALREAKYAMEINATDLWAPWIIFLIHIEQNENDLAVQEISRIWNLDPVVQVNVEPMLQAYDIGGINGVFAWLNDLDINNATEDYVWHNSFWIAQKFAFLDEQEHALEWLEIAIKRKNSELYRIKYDPFFKNMRENPKFLRLLQKMNLGDYTDRVNLIN